MSKILFFIFTACSLLFVACNRDDVKTDVLMENSAAGVGAEVVDSAVVSEVMEVAEVAPYTLVEEIDQMIEEVLSEVEDVTPEVVETAEPVVEVIVPEVVEVVDPVVEVVVPEVVEVVETVVSPEVTETVVVEPVATSCVPDIAGHMNYIHTNGLLGDELNKTNHIKGPSGCNDALIGLGTVSGDLVSVHAFWVVDTCRNEYYYNYNLASKTLVPEKSRSQCANQEWSAWQNY